MASMDYDFDGVDSHGSTLIAQAQALEGEHQAILRDVAACGDFWGGVGSNGYTQFVEELGRNFQVIYQSLHEHGNKVRTAGNNMASTDGSVGGSWAV
ncbi:WXG100 family type VII secretion target [Mycolicibacterium fortuitum]|uniref:WXG100 family type VII secretion target n=1 Tax=Mycobacteriaceae TaxID=1762 RepID=UPI0034CDEAD8